MTDDGEKESETAALMWSNVMLGIQRITLNRMGEPSVAACCWVIGTYYVRQECRTLWWLQEIKLLGQVLYPTHGHLNVNWQQLPAWLI